MILSGYSKEDRRGKRRLSYRVLKLYFSLDDYFLMDRGNEVSYTPH
jgi:hypothetical protein